MILFFAKLIFSGLALWWALHQVDFNYLHIVFKELPTGICAKAFATMCCSISLNGLRLYCIEKKLKLNESFKMLHQLTWIGMFFNQLLPGGIGGDAYRIYTLARNNNLVLSSAAILWDRILGILCLWLLSAALLLTIKLPSHIQLLATTLYCLIFAGIIFLILFIRYPVLQKYKLVANLWKIFATAKCIIRVPGVLIATSICMAITNFLAFYLLVIALKIPLSFAESSVIFTLSLIVIMIPLSISGWGLREGFLTTCFVALGLPPEMGFSLGVLQGLLMLSTGSIGAVFYLFAKKTKNSLANSEKKDIINTTKAGVAQG